MVSERSDKEKEGFLPDFGKTISGLSQKYGAATMEVTKCGDVPSSDQIKDLIDNLEHKLEKSRRLRLLFISDPVSFLVTEGLLPLATSLTISLEKGSFSDLVRTQYLLRRAMQDGRL